MTTEPDPSIFSENGVTLPGSDLTIISSDGVKFLVHKRRLACTSEIFDNMLEDGSPGGEVTLVESAAVLARLLPFAYPAIVLPFTVKFPEDLEFIEAIYKYEVSEIPNRTAVLKETDLSAGADVSVALAAWGEPTLEFSVLAAQTASRASDATLFHLWCSIVDNAATMRGAAEEVGQLRMTLF
ncbi:hypothetical protein RQP46_010731 [Phenoliferia psychrophenolica]